MLRNTILTVALLFAHFFGAFCDSLEHFFHLALLLGRYILKIRTNPQFSGTAS
jgi:hypothetical protein